MASLISLRSLAPSLFLFLFFSFAQDGRSLYIEHCSSCHHESRIGRTAPPLLPQLLAKKSDAYLIRVIREGVPSSSMPSFSYLSSSQITSIVSFLRSPVGEVSFGLKEIQLSRETLNVPKRELSIKDIRNLVVVVDKGAGEIWLMEGAFVLDKFPFKNVHGGVKFSPDGEMFYIPARDGWILAYHLKEGRERFKVRACVYLRNIALSKDGKQLAASCYLPASLVLFDKDLRVLKRIPLRGRPSAVYELNTKGGFLLAFKDVPYVAFINPEGEILYRKVDIPLEDFFIDPFEKFIVGSSRKHKKLVVYELGSLKKVFGKGTSAMPHLFSSAFWYLDGSFYFATRHLGSHKLSIWRLYDWELVKSLNLGRNGFFVRTAPSVPHLWVDNSEGEFLLLDKRSLRLQKIEVSKNGKATHVEFSPDGSIAYVSVVGQNGRLYLYDPINLKLIKKFPAKHPAGKYNFVLKSRRLLPSLLGEEVFMAKCWGCHHQTREAFAPSFRWIARNRSKAQIVSQILNPSRTAKLLGYSRSAMPKIEMSQEEIEAVLYFMEGLKEGGEMRDAKAE